MKNIIFPLAMACLIPGRLAATNTNQITAANPASAPQGTNHLLVTFTLGNNPPPPPTNVAISGVYIGGLSGTASPHTNQYSLSALFNLPGTLATGAQNVLITYVGGTVISYEADGFTVTPAASIAADFAASPTNGIAPLTVDFTDASLGTVTNRLWNFGDGNTSPGTNPVHTYNAPGNYNVSLTIGGPLGSNSLTQTNFVVVWPPPPNGAYPVVDTAQTHCYNDSSTIAPPASGQPFYGQDGNFTGKQPSYRNNGDGTISDLNTGLMWVQARGSQSTWAVAVSNAANCLVGGYTDWRMPTIKELYSLTEFTGQNGAGFTNTAGYLPFLDTNYFGFAYGPGTSTSVGSRVIDAQDWSATPYVATVMGGQTAAFGFNFTDGRLKGYPQTSSNYVRYVRGNTNYGVNHFTNNGDGTISDLATLLMWAQDDSGFGMDWSNALAWAQAMNASNYLGHSDWRLPNTKELQSIVDYTRSPATTGTAAIDTNFFNCAGITNEAGEPDFPWYWSGSTLLVNPTGTGEEGIYVCFGRAMGYDSGAWVDAHGAGAERSDPKWDGSLPNYTYVPYGYYNSNAPQGDAVRVYNYVRLVRDIFTPVVTITCPGGSAVISWPSWGTTWTLQTNGDLASPHWSNYGGTGTAFAGTNNVTLLQPSGSMFFRLRE